MIIKNKNIFHLQGKNISYIMAINECGDLLHYYYGKKLRNKNYEWIKQKGSVWNGYGPDKWTLDICPQEYPSYGYTDLRTPAYSIVNQQGGSVSRLTYKSHKITQNAVQEIDGMPNLFVGDKHVQTLEITLEDKNAGFEVVLSYTVFDEYDIIARNARILNTSDTDITIDAAYSTALDISKDNYELIHFSGGWAKEREMYRSEVRQGVKMDISNARGGSGHNINPFVMLAKSGADEDSGEVYSMTLVIRQNLCRSKWVNKERPILINNWEATYMDFNEEKLLNIAKTAKEQGVELFVLDDGWFGDRYDEETSMGDWTVNLKKIPSGIDGLAQKINDIGLKFGLWFEPESVNPKSNLYRAHPDWIVRYPGIEPTESRFEYLLDLTRDEVCEYAINSVCDILSSANIEYVKWDMNRPMTDIPRKGFNHEFTLGFYKIMDAITSRFPNVLFEGGSGGGGRFDAGVLAYMPQIWASDNSDAVKRMEIQYSTSIGYSVSSISAHVTAVPNHQNGRVTTLKTRADVAYRGAFGYELDITKMSYDELSEVRNQIELDKKLRPLMLRGDFYRLENPYTSNYCAWEMAAKDKSEVFVMCARVLAEAQASCMEKNIKLCGLNPDADYVDEFTSKVYGGDELMYNGITPEFGRYDFATQIFYFRKTEK